MNALSTAPPERVVSVPPGARQVSVTRGLSKFEMFATIGGGATVILKAFSSKPTCPSGLTTIKL
jgi:hypothetical protein